MKYKRFYFNTGVKHTDNPHTKGIVCRNGVNVIPFDVRDLPEGITDFEFLSSYLKAGDDEHYIIREVENSTVLSKFAFFKKTK